jgi:hypothetical protein
MTSIRLSEFLPFSPYVSAGGLGREAELRTACTDAIQVHPKIRADRIRVRGLIGDNFSHFFRNIFTEIGDAAEYRTVKPR